MFFPTDILVRKGKFGIIWLASTYASDRSNVLKRRDYLRVNISKSCQGIIHPSIPFALRLSSHLLLGVSRIYRKQTKIVLDDVTQIWTRMNDALMVSRRSLELAAPVVRYDVITLSDPVESETMHYTLEPFRHDIIFDPTSLFAGDSCYVNVNGDGDIFRSPSKSSVRSSSSDMMTSPMQARHKDITISDVLFSPNQLIQVPGEVDFGPALEEDPFERLDILSSHIGGAHEDQPRQETTEKEPEINDVQEAIPPVIQDIDIVAENVEAVDAAMTDIAKGDGSPQEKSWQEISSTPLSNIKQAGRAPSQPRKRRRLAVDRDIQLTGDAMRSNLADPDSTLRQVILGSTPILPVNELFSQPAVTYLASQYMAEIWRHNARTFPDPTLHEGFMIMDGESELESPDRILRLGVTPSSIEIPRAAPEISTDFERSAASTLTMDRTPHSHEDQRRKSSGAERQLHRVAPRRESENRAGFTLLSPIADEFAEDLAIPLEEIDEDQFAIEIGQDDIPSPKQDEFLRYISDLLANKEIILFSEIAPPHTTRRKMAARAFSYILVFNTRQVINVDQEELFGEITITRGRAF